MCLCFPSSVLWCLLRFQHTHDVRFVFTFSCVWYLSCLICVSCVRLSKVVSNTYYVVFLLCFSLPFVSYVASFPGLSICDCPALFFNVYLGKCKNDHHTWIISAISFYLVETKVCNVLILCYYSYQKLLQCCVSKFVYSLFKSTNTILIVI